MKPIAACYLPYLHTVAGALQYGTTFRKCYGLLYGFGPYYHIAPYSLFYITKRTIGHHIAMCN